MSRLKNVFPSDTLKTIYDSLINCHLLYGIILWGHLSSYITKIQKRAVRIISKSKYNAHTEPIFKKYNILKVNDILKVQEWKFIHHFINNKLPKYFDHFSFPRFTDVHQHNTRNNIAFVTPCLRYNVSTCSIKKRLPSIMNNAHRNLTEKLYSHSINGLVFYLKQTFINSYESTCHIQNCYICRNM